MKKPGLLFMGWLLWPLLLLWPGFPPEVIAPSLRCSTTTVLTGPVEETASSPRCYGFTLSSGSDLLLVALEPTQGAFDLYLKQSPATVLDDLDKVTPSSTGRKVVYALLAPQAGTHTIAVAPAGKEGSYRLSAASRVSGSNQPGQRCAADTCQATYPLVATGNGIALGSNFGDQAIFPIEIGQAGPVEVEVTWSGSGRNLSLYLDGPDEAYDQIDGRSPLSLSYEVEAEELSQDALWRVRLVNANRTGGSVAGTLVITYPR